MPIFLRSAARRVGISLACGAATVLMLTGCGGGGATSSSSVSTSGVIQGNQVTDEAIASVASGGVVDQAALTRVVDAIDALPAAGQRAALKSLSLRADLEAAKISGLAAAIGGPAATTAALRGAWARVAKGMGAVDAATHLKARHRSVQSVSADANPQVVGVTGLVMALMGLSLVADPIVSAANSHDVEPGQFGKGTTVTGTAAESAITMEFNGQQDGVDVKFKATAVVHPCPKPDGTFDAKITMDIATSKGNVGNTITQEIAITGQVDNDAKLASKNVVNHTQWADFGGGKGQFLDFTAAGPSGLDTFKVNRTGGNVTDSFVRLSVIIAGVMGTQLGEKYLDAAEQAWLSGRCVTLNPTASPGPTGLDPSASSTLRAAPRSKLDGTPTGGTVTARLTSGGASVAPATKVPAPAGFDYKAPDKKNESGTIAFESRSKRGVGKATLVLDTRRPGYTARWSGGGLVLTGTIADLGAPFTLAGTFPGGTATFSYTPTTDRSGSLKISGGGSGAKLAGGGSYKVTENPDGTLTLTEQTHACVNVSGACRSDTHKIALTPAG